LTFSISFFSHEYTHFELFNIYVNKPIRKYLLINLLINMHMYNVIRFITRSGVICNIYSCTHNECQNYILHIPSGMVSKY
jgi:hypothetical protein